MGKAKMLGYCKPCKSGSMRQVKAPWQGPQKKHNPERKSQGGVFHEAKQSKA